MNRVLKFRAFDKTNNQMFYWELPNFDSKHASHYDNLMQFTGLKDQKGNDIYEGDIIGDWTDVDGKMEQSKLTVYFDEMLGQWMLNNSSKQDKTISYSLFSELQDFEYEIIGNIYENPDLLPT